VALRTTSSKIGVPASPELGAQPHDLDDHYLVELGIVADGFSKKNGLLGCEGQSLPGYTGRVSNFIRSAGHSPAEGPYAYFCGASHAEFWRIAQGYRLLNDDTETFIPVTTRDEVRNALTMCIDALVYPARQLFAYLGRGAAFADLRRLDSRIRTAFAPLARGRDAFAGPSGTLRVRAISSSSRRATMRHPGRRLGAWPGLAGTGGPTP
jgi:hypothetical protein